MDGAEDESWWNDVHHVSGGSRPCQDRNLGEGLTSIRRNQGPLTGPFVVDPIGLTFKRPNQHPVIHGTTKCNDDALFALAKAAVSLQY